ncbi:MAG: type II 3-dehydroquinate dehydratase [Clostridia bacterium]|nr:type II 3-dehydroquinate dehydratase [Clostridia bacterium]
MDKILVINGPNLNLLGEREKELYGNRSIDYLGKLLKQKQEQCNTKIDIVQSNHEGEIIDFIQSSRHKYNGIVINPGAYTHYSYAIRDAIAAINIPVVEVHITNIHAREEFRSKSVIAPVCKGQISGLGFSSYLLAIDFIVGLEV